MLPTSLYCFGIATAVMESLPEVKSFCVYQDPFIENLEKEKETRFKRIKDTNHGICVTEQRASEMRGGRN